MSGTLINGIENIPVRPNKSMPKPRQKFNADTQERLNKEREVFTSRSFLVKRSVGTGKAPANLRGAL